MADYEAVNAVAAGSIEAINGVAKSSVESVNGATTPSSGATRWAMVAADASAGYAASSDLTSWTVYETEPNEGTDYKSIHYGKDGSGNPRYVITWGESDAEIQYTNDITSSSWTTVNLSGSMTIWDAAWGNNVWCAVGTMSSGAQKVWRSTDGATWAEIDISGATDISTDVVKSIATDGAGNWIFGQKDRIYHSTNDGSAWSLAVDFDDSDIAGIRCVAYTNSTWVLMLQDTGAGGGCMIRTAAASDRTDWSTAQDLNIGASAVRLAAGGGKVIAIYSNDHQLATVSGKTCTLATYTANQLPASNSRNIATDGNGTWVVVHDQGDISTTPDDGSNWTLSVDGLVIDGTVHSLDDVTPNVYMPV